MPGQIGRRLTGKRRIGRADPLALVAVTSGAGGDTARRIALVIEAERRTLPRVRGERHCSIMEGDRLALLGAELPGDPVHLRVLPPAVGIGFQLPLQITAVDAGQPRRARAVAAAVQPVAGEAGIGRPRRRTAQRDHFAIRRQPIDRSGRSVGATTKDAGRAEKKEFAHALATLRPARRFRPLAAASLLLLAAACKPPPDERQAMPLADAGRGRAAIERVGCASCHTMKGIRWPRGQAGPELTGFGTRALIAGKLPNRPDLLAAFIRNAPALVPGTGMPAMPVSEAEARDIAAYLYQQEMR